VQFQIIKPIFASELSSFLNLEIKGNARAEFTSIGQLDDQNKSSLKFSNKIISEAINGVVIGDHSLNAKCIIVSKNARLDFCKALQFLKDSGYLVRKKIECHIDNTAMIHPSAQIEEYVSIGKNSIIEANVTIHSGSYIGENTVIRANSVIGAQGFGFEKDLDQSWLRFMHLGGLVIGNNVEIGSLNSICIGTLSNTIIEDGVKTDNLVHIAHNCRVGQNSVVTACAELSGGVKVGKNVWIGPNSCILQKIKIGDSAMVGIGSVVTKNVDDGCTVAGNPARLLKISKDKRAN